MANGTQGWLKIRAEMTDGGVVNASVSATTSAGQEMLHRELPSLTAYLQQEQIGVALWCCIRPRRQDLRSLPKEWTGTQGAS